MSSEFHARQNRRRKAAVYSKFCRHGKALIHEEGERMKRGVSRKRRKVRSVTIFGIVELAILVLFFVFMPGNYFVARSVSNRRSCQMVADSYHSITENVVQDIKNISQAGFTLLNTETVTRLKTYYYDLILEDSYARNTAINNTIDQLVSLVSYYSILDACALWIAPSGELSYNSMYTFVGDEERRQALDDAIASHVFAPTYDGALRNRNGKILMTLSLSETDSCVLALLLDTQFFVDHLSLTTMPQTTTTCISSGGTLWFFCGTKDVETPASFEILSDGPVLDGGKIIYGQTIAGKIPLYAQISTSQIGNATSGYIAIFLVACVLLCGVALIFFCTFRHFFNRPVHRLLEAMDEVSRGNFSVQIKDKIGSDFQYVYDGFNFMTSSLNGYIEENYRQRVMRTESEFKALQAQINPHFLYNCFANIRSFCKMGDMDSVALMTDKLSKLFLYVTRNAEPIVTIREEYEHMLNYLEIQKLRFCDRVQVEIGELPEQVANLKIPKLCLQPIAENAYKYAFADIESGGVFRVLFRREDNRFQIMLEDNGSALTDAQIDAINISLHQAQEASGLVNVARRLEHYTGGKGGLHAERSVLGGLAIVIDLRQGGNDV